MNKIRSDTKVKKILKMIARFVGIACLCFISAMSTSENMCNELKNRTVACDFIPQSLPEGTLGVLLNLKLASDLYLNSSSFASSGWDKVTQLEFRVGKEKYFTLGNNCFSGLRELRILKIHTESHIHLDIGSFKHLDNVQVLDLSGSVRLHPTEFMNALEGNSLLPRLTTLLMSNCCVYRKHFTLDGRLLQNLESRKISHLDVSGLQIGEVNCTAMAKRMPYLTMLNMSHATFDNIESDGIGQGDIRYIKSLDLSFTTFPKKKVFYLPGKIRIVNLNVDFSNMVQMESLKFLLSPEVLNISGLVPEMTSCWAWNCRVHIDKSPDLFTKTLVARRNNIKRLDVAFICEKFNFSSFENIDLSENKMEFIHPSILACLPNIQKINLSGNMLFKMAKENISLFEDMFTNLEFLKHISLSSNKFTDIPEAMLKKNKLVEEIDLSNNNLKQVHFSLTELKRLRVLNLQGNNIETLDHRSISNLKDLQHIGESTGQSASVNLRKNTLDCSKCESEMFLSWLTSTHLVDVSSQKLVCTNENGIKEDVSEHVVDKVKKICKRKVIITASSVSVGGVCFVSAILFTIFHKQRKRARKIRKRENIINMLRIGEGDYNFLAFLVLCSDDEEFVDTHIKRQLNENLQLMTGIDRELVCTGDRNFRPGFNIHNETYVLLDKATVVVAAVSNKSCDSIHCQNEIDKAYMNKKPVLLMLIEQIDENKLTPIMRELYHNNVRVLWTFENGEYKMKTTWDNVCTSILELIK